MTKTSLKKSWIILNSLSLFGTVIALACAGDWGPEFGTSNFTPEVFVANAYSPFFYSDQYYYGIGHDEGQLTRWNETNTRDWAAWLGANTSIPQLNYLLDTANIKTIEELLNQHPDKKTTAFLHYLFIAKKTGVFALNPIRQPWDTDTTKKAPFDATTLNRQLQQALTTTADPFLKERYWFQLVRSYFFNGTPQQTIHLFEDYRAKFPANKIWYRSLAYMAGAWHRLKDYGKANYYYSRVFDSCDELKMAAHYSFHPQEQADWNATLALCHTNEEKATLWQMVGIFYSDPDNAISEIYRLDPKSEKLEVLLSRAVNASEQRFGDPEDDYMPPRPSDSSNRQLRLLVSRIAEAGNTSKPWIWQLAAGYLCMLDKDYRTAVRWYARAQTTVPAAPLPQAQFSMLKLLNTVAAAPTIDGPLEKRITPDVSLLLRYTDSSPGTAVRHEAAISWLRHNIAEKYRRAGDKVRSECWFSRSAFYTDAHNVETLKTFLARKDKTPWEQLCARMSIVKDADISEYQAISYTLDDRLDEALTAMNEAPSAGNETLPGNPFNARINDCHDCDHDAPQKIKYTRFTFLQKLREIKDSINKGRDIYTNAILLGNAQYNATYYGNARAFYDCKVMVPDDVLGHDSTFDDRLTSMKMAVKYYTLALAAAQNNEQRAKCQYLLAKCQRNEWYNNPTGAYQHQPDFIAFDGFKKLKQYANTNYYKEVIRECGYFNTYIQKNP